MINVKIGEVPVKCGKEIFNSNYKYPNLNVLDILKFRYIDERLNHKFNHHYNFMVIGNLKSIRNYFLDVIKKEQGNIKRAGKTAKKHIELLNDFPDIFSFLVEQGIVNIEKIKTILKAENKTAYLEMMNKDIKRKISLLLKEQGKKPIYKINFYDIGLLQEQGKLTENAQYSIYNYLRKLQVNRTCDSLSKSEYINSHPYINEYMQGNNISRENQIKPLISDRIKRKVAFKTASLLFIHQSKKDYLLKDLLLFIEDFNINSLSSN